MPIWRFEKMAIPKKKRYCADKKVDKCQQKFVMCLFGCLQNRPFQKKQPFSSKLAPTKSSNHLYMCEFRGKMLAQYLFFVFFGIATFSKPQIHTRKNPLTIKSIKQKENQYPNSHFSQKYTSDQICNSF